MLKHVGRWIRGEGSAPVEGEPASGESGARILRETAERRRSVQAIRDCLATMSLEEKDALVDGVLARLAGRVGALPAPEGPGTGRTSALDRILDHAGRTACRISGPGFSVSPEPSVDHRERPRWVYGGVIGSVAAGLGELARWDIVHRSRGALWEPAQISFAQFMGPPGGAAALDELEFRERPAGIAAWGEELLRQVTGPGVEAYLGFRWPAILAAIRGSSGGVGAVHEIAGGVVREMRGVAPSAPGLPERKDGAPGGPVALPPGLSLPPGTIRTGGVPPEVGVWPGTASVHRGDPVEADRKLQAWLEPGRWRQTIRRMIIHGRLPRNTEHAEVYLGREVVWLIYPEAFGRIARIYRLPWDDRSRERMVEALRRGDATGRGTFPSAPVPIRIGASPFGRVRERVGVAVATKSLLTDAEVEALGLSNQEIHWDGPGPGPGSRETRTEHARL